MRKGNEPRANYNADAKVKVPIVTNKIITLNIIFATMTWKWTLSDKITFRVIGL